MAWVAVDDTDSSQGGCTTHVAFELVTNVVPYDLIGYPRLVRLNPNVPFKTRGNGAVAVRFGHGKGPRFVVGKNEGRAIVAYANGDDLSLAEAENVYERVREYVGRASNLGEPRTDPGLVVSAGTIDPALYWQAVSRMVTRQAALDYLGRQPGVRWVQWKRGQGLVGAASALSWPAARGTFELLAYRRRSRWGMPRRVAGDLAARVRQTVPGEFDTEVPGSRRLRGVPTSPCPVLLGVRSRTDQGLSDVLDSLGPEQPQGGLVFLTNQATDDHLVNGHRIIGRSFAACSVQATVCNAPVTIQGGHVFVRCADLRGQRFDAAAFEPTKDLRRVLRHLAPGDEVAFWGGTHEDPTLVAVEGVEIRRRAPRVTMAPPRCQACAKTMKSRGRGNGYRCTRCRTRAAARATVVHSTAPTGRFGVGVQGRRHLSRPMEWVDQVEPPQSM